jgi:putative heme-binding domain-containing protein
VVRQQYVYHLIKTRDGRVLTGLLATLSPATVTLLDAANQRTEIERADIVAMDPIPVSLMPEGLLQGLSDDDLRDLFAYLRRDKP